MWPTLIPPLFFHNPQDTGSITRDQCRATNHLRSLGTWSFLFKVVLNSVVASHTQNIQNVSVSCSMRVITLTCMEGIDGFIIGLYVMFYVFLLPDLILKIILKVCILYFIISLPFITLTSNLYIKLPFSLLRRLIFCSRLVLLTLRYSKSAALLKRRIWQLISSILHL